MSTTWDPRAYARFGDERTRPFVDLLTRIAPDADPGLVVDLGCGNGPATMTLVDRWPSARIVGIDSSPAMIGAARALDTQGRVEWVLDDLRTWDPAGLSAAPDVIVTNAALQWVDGHVELFRRWVAALAPGGWFGLQVPGNFTAPSHLLMREAAIGHPRETAILHALQRPRSEELTTYLEALLDLGLQVDAWESTYLHLLDPGAGRAHPVLEWVRATGLRPALAAIDDDGERTAYERAYAERLAAAYPRGPRGVVLPFRRLFAVGQRAQA